MSTNPIFYDLTPFVAAEDANNGIELWKTDGTEDGTVMVKDINSMESSSSAPETLISYKGNILFTAFTEDTGREWWISDGTETETRLIKDITEDNYDGAPLSPAIISENSIYFPGYNHKTGREIWQISISE